MAHSKPTPIKPTETLIKAVIKAVKACTATVTAPGVEAEVDFGIARTHVRAVFRRLVAVRIMRQSLTEAEKHDLKRQLRVDTTRAVIRRIPDYERQIKLMTRTPALFEQIKEQAVLQNPPSS
jgi:hypothetical protein